jgi:ribonuclease HII
MLEIQKDLSKIEVGVDEAGRGCLAGPVVAAAVIIPKGFSFPEVDDSKKLSRKKRAELYQSIIGTCPYFGIGSAEAEEIDDHNILNASFLAMHRALDKIETTFENILVDGNRFNPFGKYPFECIVRGDSKYQCIAAASILAKHFRDELMTGFAKDFPDYKWEKNFGYPTREHRNAIAKSGSTPLHRKSFNLLQSQYPIF